MRLKLLLPLVLCAVLAGCASDSVSETDISRATAISIAERHCPQYPDQYGYVDHADWMTDGGYWLVAITDRDGDVGQAFKISHAGVVIDSGSLKQHTDPVTGHLVRKYYW